MLGLKNDQNLIEDYDPLWPDEFVREARKIERSLVAFEHSVEHYGSTSVPGLRAKPIIDILVGIRPFEQWRLLQQPLEELGYDYAEHAGVPGHHIFGKGRSEGERTHLVHVVELDGDEWCSGLRFRDALRRDPKLRQRYLAAKEEAAAKAPIGRAEYNELKSKFFTSFA
jgi:GrpB-like predicted nucleotidyltransferase (UPF0157 family)